MVDISYCVNILTNSLYSKELENKSITREKFSEFLVNCLKRLDEGLKFGYPDDLKNIVFTIEFPSITNIIDLTVRNIMNDIKITIN
jgi:hypothetical protein